MTFIWPIALLGLVLVPCLLAGYVVFQRRRTRYAMRFTNVDLLANVVDEAPRWRRHVPAALFIAALAALLVSVARPQAVVSTPQDRAAVVLAIDVSRSMEATDVEPSRLRAAQDAAETFLDKVPDDLQVGLVIFSSEAQVLVTPTADHDQVRNALSFLRADGGTAIGDAIIAATSLADDSGASFASLAGSDKSAQDGTSPLSVLLLSDGAPSPDTADPIEAANQASEQGIKVFTVALGTDEGTVTLSDPFGNDQVVPVPPDRETLGQIADITGAQFFEAPTEEALTRVYADLGSDIGFSKERHEITFAFAAAGGLLLLAGGVLSLLWFSRLP